MLRMSATVRRDTAPRHHHLVAWLPRQLIRSAYCDANRSAFMFSCCRDASQRLNAVLRGAGHRRHGSRGATSPAAGPPFFVEGTDDDVDVRPRRYAGAAKKSACARAASTTGHGHVRLPGRRSRNMLLQPLPSSLIGARQIAFRRKCRPVRDSFAPLNLFSFPLADVG